MLINFQDNVLPKKEFKYTFKTITEINNQSFCPDFHNLTVLGYSSEEKTESSNEWKISIEDFNELMKENKKIPKTSSGKASFVSRIEKTLQDEAGKHQFPKTGKFVVHYESLYLNNF